jgi:two-component system CheB/CheR fusion protein
MDKTLIRSDVEVQDDDGNWYAMSTSPYRTTDNVIDGVVMTFVDISKIKTAENMQRLASVVSDSF